MTVTPGTKLGPYEIISPLGAGGMGEVYRARDTRLNRTVAVKVLPPDFSADSGRLQRFEQEARLLSTLNHPNILAIYDVGHQDGVHYIVSELLEGETLRRRIEQGPLAVRKATEYAIQIAQGLAAAHGKGIVHRDLKPENIFLTNDGRVKILDFGLAKGVQGSALDDATQTVASQPGVVLGTVGYMSPEQVRGKPTDARSDLFSFGTVLYEMVCGQRAFRGDSSVEVMNAILKDDPPELVTAERKVPPALDRIVRRCLEKNPEERFESARDMAFALEGISAASTASGAVPRITTPRKRTAWLVLGGLAALVVAGGAFLGFERRAPLPEYKQLTFDSGYAGSARFSRDGGTIVYSAAWNGGAEQMYSQRANASTPQPMNIDAEVVGIADNGDMAVILNRRFLASWLQSGTLARLPIEGGTPRPILEDVYSADISRDGKDFAVVRSLAGKQRLEYPIGKVLYETDGWIGCVRISPDGNAVAFINHAILVDDRGSIDIIDRSGHHRALTADYSSAHTLAWTPDGKEIWHSGTMTADEDSIWAVTLAGKVRKVVSSPIETHIQDISSSGRVLLESIRYNLELGVKRASERNSRLLDVGIIDLTSVSKDGEWLVYTHLKEGKNEVYLRRSNGAAPVVIGEGFGAGLSYDGRVVAAVRLDDPNKLLLYPAGPGEKREIDLGELSAESSSFENGVTFSRDGRFALLTAFNRRRELRGYLLDLSDGKIRPATPVGSKEGRLSPDGKQVVTTELASSRRVIVDIESGKVREVPGLTPHDEVIGWTEDGKSLSIWNMEMPAKVWTLDIASGRRTFVQTVEPVANLGAMYARLVTCADGRVAVYRLRRGMYALYLSDGLR